MSGRLLEFGEAVTLIESGKTLGIAGDEGLLNRLPSGNWIGGTIPYFMTREGGQFTRTKVHVTEFDDAVGAPAIKLYDQETIKRVFLDAPENGMSLIIVPALSEIHASYAMEAPNFEAFATRPLIGWIAGTALDDFGTVTAKVYDGGDVTPQANKIAVMHMKLPADKVAEISIVNIFSQGDGAVISFPTLSWSAESAVIDGEERSLAGYIEAAGIDTKLPLVADYFGAMINTSIQSIDDDTKKTSFYAPVFPGVTYRFAKPIDDYAKAFEALIPAEAADCAFLCNCILNYLYGELEGKKTGDATGPVTFGEIAYQLLNQTMAYMVIHSV